MQIHLFKEKLSALSNAVSCKVVQRIGRELFDLNARGDIFMNHPVSYELCKIIYKIIGVYFLPRLKNHKT